MRLTISSQISQQDVALICATKAPQVLAGSFISWFCFSLLLRLKPLPPRVSMAYSHSVPQKAEVTETQRTTLSLQLPSVKGWWPPGVRNCQ